jgi:hypothetical protein
MIPRCCLNSTLFFFIVLSIVYDLSADLISEEQWFKEMNARQILLDAVIWLLFLMTKKEQVLILLLSMST